MIRFRAVVGRNERRETREMYRGLFCFGFGHAIVPKQISSFTRPPVLRVDSASCVINAALRRVRDPFVPVV